MSPRVEALISLSALRHNLQCVRQAAPGCHVVAAIKANGYGHGLVEVASALGDADYLGVACLDEALHLRNAGIRSPILLLEGVLAAQELVQIQEHDLAIVVHQQNQIDWLKTFVAKQNRPFEVWLKIDTGMHRLGFDPALAAHAHAQLCAIPAVAALKVVMSHLANADDRTDGKTDQQIRCFQQTLSEWDLPRSLANSAAILAWPEAHGQWVRPGIMLYGVSPLQGQVGLDHDLRPVMTLSSRLIAAKQVAAGETVGYGGTWCCPEDMLVGVVAVGYGDGYPRHASNGTPVLVNGRRVPLIGRVSMDMITVDLRSQPLAAAGDSVVLWGEGLPVEEIAQAAGTIAYELLCGVSKRVEFQYRD